jgi:uncharacterized tellurite resistance protein B-like protein
MLIDTIRSLFKSPSDAAPARPPVDDAFSGVPATTDSPAPQPEPVALAACVLLLEIAHADGEFSAAEREHLEQVLDRHFGLPDATGRALIEQAERERRSSVDHFSFTQQIKRDYDLGQKMVLAEVMWGLVLADGTVNDHEHYLTRKISNLLDLEPAYLSAAKDAAAKRIA